MTWFTKGLRLPRDRACWVEENKTKMTWFTKGLRPWGRHPNRWYPSPDENDLIYEGIETAFLTLKIYSFHFRRKWPDLRRDWDCNGLAGCPPSRHDENDLIYEGIETRCANVQTIRAWCRDENDLIYEGIETNVGRRQRPWNHQDENDLIYEGIETILIC